MKVANHAIRGGEERQDPGARDGVPNAHFMAYEMPRVGGSTASVQNQTAVDLTHSRSCKTKADMIRPPPLPGIFEVLDSGSLLAGR